MIDDYDMRGAYLRRGAPMPRQMARGYRFGVILAKWAGVVFAPGQVKVRAFRGEPHEGYGITLHKAVPVLVFLNATQDASVFHWSRVVTHELQHCVDARDPAMSVDERERRAEQFDARAMLEWPRLVELLRTIGMAEDLG